MQPKKLPQVPSSYFPPNSYNQYSGASNVLPPNKPKRSRIIRYLQERRIFLLVTLLILIPTIFVILVYKYDIFGVVKKQHYSIMVIDSQTSQPLSNATVNLRGQTVTTNSAGQATFPRIKVGDAVLSIKHIYYQNYQTTTLVTFTNHNYHVFAIKGVGTEISIFVSNRFTQKPISGAVVNALQSSVTTNSIGHAVINLPSDQALVEASVTADTYNVNKVSINNNTINSYTMVPTGKTYYLNSGSPNVSLVQSDLDGTNSVPVVPASASATPANTHMLASPDSKYIAVTMPDAANTPTLYVYNVAKKNFVSIGQSPLGMNIYGWTPDDILIYTAVANGIPDDGGSGSKLIAYNASSKSPKPYRLDTANIGGFNSFSSSQQNYNSVIVLNDDNVLFSKYWTGVPATIASSSTTITAILGSSNKVFQIPESQQSLTPTTNYSSPPKFIYTSPNTVAIAYTNAATNKVSYFTFAKGKITASTAQALATTIANPPTSSPYYLSPSGAYQMWSRLVDGKTTIYVGDKNGGSAKAIANFDNYQYTPYGWWTDDYILLNSNGLKLSIIPASGTDNQKRVQNISSFTP